MREKIYIYCERHLGDYLLSKQISLTASESWLKTQFLVITSHKREQIKPQAKNGKETKTSPQTWKQLKVRKGTTKDM